MAVLKRFPLLCFLLSLMGCAVTPVPEAALWYEVKTHKSYADVQAELELAITEQNFRITGHNHIGSVIRERDNLKDFPDYDTYQFCNLSLAREMLEISPAAVAYMPCNISLRTEQGLVVITTHLLPTDSPDSKLNDFFKGLNGKLKKIVDFAAEQ